MVKTVLFKGFVGWLITALVFYLSPFPYAYANPVGGNVAGGSATISSAGKTETINQTSGKAVIDWSQFNINSGETTKFVQPNASSLTVNRVHDNDPSKILGTLSANGNLVLINPNGVFFGKGSRVDVNGIIATTSDMKNSDVMAGGKLHFTPGGNPNATVANEGTITAGSAGLVGLVAPNVINSGVITANLGKVQLSSGDSFTLDLYGDKLLEIGVSDAVGKQLVENSGSIEAAGGTVKLTAAAGRQIVNSLIDVKGKINAPSFAEKNGEIVIYAEGSNAVKGNASAEKVTKQGVSVIQVSGKLDASGSAKGQKGGKISVLGDNVAIKSGAEIDASGLAGGGTVKIGGDFHGTGNTPTAAATVVENGSVIDASAKDKGDGGNVVVWSDFNTTFAGKIMTNGGPNGGNGGFVETSGHEKLSLADANGNNGAVDASAPKGQGGTWLLDPANLTIDGNTTNSTGNPNFVPNGTASEVKASDIVTALNAGTNVTVTTGGDAFAGSGDITVSSPISATGAGTNITTTGNLTISAYRNITVSAAITLGGGTNNSSQTVTGGNLILGSDNGTHSNGYVYVAANLTTNGGNITIGGGANPATGYSYGNSSFDPGVWVNGVTVDAGGGNIVMNGTGWQGGITVGGETGWITYNTDSTYQSTGGMQATNSTIQTTGTGSITLNGKGGVSAQQSYTMSSVLFANGVNVYTQNGSTTINASNLNANYGHWSGFQWDGTGTMQATGTGSINVTSTLNGSYSSTWSALGGYDVTSGGDTHKMQTTTGNITLSGNANVAGAGTNRGWQGTGNSSLVTTTGNVSITGTSANNASGTGYSLLVIPSVTTAGGNVSETGTCSAGGTCYGIFALGNVTATGAGSITMTGYGSAATGIDVTAAKTIGNPTAASYTGNITWVTDGFTLGATPTSSTSGTVTYKPYTAGTTVGVNGGGGTLQVNSTLLTATTASEIDIGATNDTGLLTAAAYSPSTALKLISGSGGITTAGLTMAANNLTLQTDGALTLGGGANSITGTGTLSILPASAGSSVGVNGATCGGSCTLNITNTDLAAIHSGFGNIVIGNSSGTGAMDVDAYTWNAPVTFQNGSGGIKFESGTTNSGSNALIANTSGNITLASGSAISSTSSGNAIILAASGNFVNNSGSNSPLTAGSGNWVVYSTQASSDTNGASVMNPATTLYSHAAYPNISGVSGNTWIYSSGAPTTPENITLTASNQTVTYGTSPNTTPTFNTTYTCSGAGCSYVASYSGGTITISGSTSSSSNYTVAGGHTITLSGVTPTWNSGYSTGTITYNTGTLTVNAKPISITGFAANNKGYDGTTAATISSNGSLSGVVGIDTVSINAGSASATFSDKNVANGKTVTAAGYALAGLDSGNYSLSAQPTTTANITTRAITVTAATNSKGYDGTTSAAATGSITAGSLAAGDSATWTEVYTNKNVGAGNKTLTASGDVVTDGNGGNNYAVTFVDNTTGTITARAITVTAATNTKGYDGTTSAAATPTITVGSLAAGDSATWSETYADKNASVGKTLTPAGSVTDGNGGANYTVTFVNDATGVINARAITVTATANTKGYDGTTSAAATGSITVGSLVAGDSATWTEVYTNKNAGAGNKTLTAAGDAVTDGNGGNNYAVTFVDNATGTITPAAITVTAAANTKTYDGGTSAGATPTVTVGSIMAGDTANFTETYSDKNAGAGKTLTPAGSVTDGNGGNNYSFTFANSNAGVINQAHLTVTADDQTMTQGSNLPTLTSTITGFVGGENLGTSGVTGSASTSTAATNNSPAGSYAINAALGTLAALNYDFAFNNGTLTISAANNGGGGGGGIPPAPQPQPAPHPQPVPVPTPTAPVPTPTAPAPTPAPVPTAPKPIVFTLPYTDPDINSVLPPAPAVENAPVAKLIDASQSTTLFNSVDPTTLIAPVNNNAQTNNSAPSGKKPADPANSNASDEKEEKNVCLSSENGSPICNKEKKIRRNNSRNESRPDFRLFPQERE